MISAREVQRLAYEHQVPEQMIERDYVLTWLLGALATPQQAPRLIAKGGTALKKIYFADWRYSEDLDFTCEHLIGSTALETMLIQACRRVSNEAGLGVQVGSLEIRRDGESLRNMTAYIEYVGPLQRTRRARELKVDVTFDEVVVNAPVVHPLIQLFSDEPNPVRRVLVYSLEEICAEKIRTLLQRTEPRDLYDGWRILSERSNQLNQQTLVATFHRKCQHRGVTFVSANTILSPERVGKFRTAWERRLGQQVPDLVPLDRVVRETRRWLKELLD